MLKSTFTCARFQTAFCPRACIAWWSEFMTLRHGLHHSSLHAVTTTNLNMHEKKMGFLTEGLLFSFHRLTTKNQVTQSTCISSWGSQTLWISKKYFTLIEKQIFQVRTCQVNHKCDTTSLQASPPVRYFDRGGWHRLGTLRTLCRTLDDWFHKGTFHTQLKTKHLQKSRNMSHVRVNHPGWQQQQLTCTTIHSEWHVWNANELFFKTTADMKLGVWHLTVIHWPKGCFTSNWNHVTKNNLMTLPFQSPAKHLEHL